MVEYYSLIKPTEHLSFFNGKISEVSDRKKYTFLELTKMQYAYINFKLTFPPLLLSLNFPGFAHLRRRDDEEKSKSRSLWEEGCA